MAVANDQLAYMTASDLSTLIRRRELSPVDVVDAFIQRIEARNKSLNAFVYSDFEGARTRAREAERALVSGAELGALHGVPTALKDLFSLKRGWPCTNGGVKAYRDMAADSDGTYAERMEQAGAILLGLTNSPVMGYRGTCDNYMFGPTRNPFDLSRNSGGSSGGSAAAVADGLIPIAEATDGGGSIRIPASWCGVYGYKATFGLVPFNSRPDAFMGASPFLFKGTVTRTVEDAALGLNALAGYDPRDPFSLDGQVDFTAALRRSIKGLRIAYSPDFDIYPVDKRVSDVVGRAVKAFEDAGAHVEQVRVGIKRHQRELSDLWCRLISAANVGMLEESKRSGIDLLRDYRHDFPPQFIAWVEKAYGLTILDMVRDQQMRSEIYDAIESVFANYDLLVTPTLACLPVLNDSDGNTAGPTEINGEAIDPLIGWCMTYLVNFTGHPAASIPAGLAEGNLPVGMQLIARRHADLDLLAASAAFERLRPWQHTYEICASRPL